MGTQLPPKKREQSLNFWPMCVVAKWLDGLIFNMPLGMEVGLGPGDFVLDGDPNKKGDTAPNFRPRSIVANRLDGSICHLVAR